MELFKLYSHEKTDFFCLIKLLFIKVRCLINVSLEAKIEDKGGKQHCLPFVGSNLGVEIFLKKRIEAPLYALYWGFKNILCEACLLFNCFLVIKRILKALFSFIP